MAYDSCTNGIGRVCSVSDATGTTAYAYDPQGDITARTFTLGSTSYALGYSYDGGRIATITYPDASSVTEGAGCIVTRATCNSPVVGLPCCHEVDLREDIA